jgi:16S rRNA (guanine966-N2)-methyltransferase
MGERIRGAVFNKLVGYLSGAVVLDAFAGTGALGLEALSRGAKEVTLVEKDRKAQKVIADNIEALNVEQKAKLVRASVNGWLRSTLAEHDKKDLPRFDIIFADPPYWDPQFRLVERLVQLLAPSGVLVLSHAKALDTPELAGLRLIDRREYSDAVIAYFEPI